MQSVQMIVLNWKSIYVVILSNCVSSSNVLYVRSLLYLYTYIHARMHTCKHTSLCLSISLVPVCVIVFAIFPIPSILSVTSQLNCTSCFLLLCNFCVEQKRYCEYYYEVANTLCMQHSHQFHIDASHLISNSFHLCLSFSIFRTIRSFMALANILFTLKQRFVAACFHYY